MHPMRLITYAVLTSIVTLLALGGIGFYVGYSMGRGNMKELKTLIAAGGSPENAQALVDAIKEQAGVSSQSASDVDLEPLLEEIRSMSSQLGDLERQVAQQPQPTERVVEKVKDDPGTQQELANVKQLLAETNNQYQVCRQNLTTLQSQFEELKTSTQVALSQPANTASQTNGSVVLFDNVLLKRNENKLYRDVDVSLSLQSMDARSARLAVNRKPVAIAFGERKIFQHRDVTCELVLTETDLEGGKARVSIACKR